MSMIFRRSSGKNWVISPGLTILLLTFNCIVLNAATATSFPVGVATADITPQTPIRLAGFGIRVKTESEGVAQKLNAKALAFGSDAGGASILITVDLIGIPGHITKKVAASLQKKAGIDPSRIAICASHTHSGPEVGTLINILQFRTARTFSDSLLPANQLEHIAQYVNYLTEKLEKVALAALKNREASYVSWGIGHTDFAKNRRVANGPVDQSLPIMKITDLNHNLKAVFVSYACHAVAMGADLNSIHGDWVGEAQRIIEEQHSDVVALVAVGCGADANPSLNGAEKNMTRAAFTTECGNKIANEVTRLLKTNLRPVTKAPSGKLRFIDIPYAEQPTIETLRKQAKEGFIKGYYSRLALEQVSRGETLPAALKDFPVQVWHFGKELTMIFLGGETLSGYSLRLKEELGAEKIWVNGYANDVPCYIPSEKTLTDERYSYENHHSMYYYNRPSRFAAGLENRIISTVYDILPSYLSKRKK